jgi:hypothetical protein
MNKESLRARLLELRERERMAFVELGKALGAQDELERLLNEWEGEEPSHKPEGSEDAQPA